MGANISKQSKIHFKVGQSLQSGKKDHLKVEQTLFKSKAINSKWGIIFLVNTNIMTCI